MFILTLESKILEDSIKSTQDVIDVTDGMKFPKIEADVVEECNSLEEIKIFFENYFIKSLGYFNHDWTQMAQKVKAKIENSATLVEVIVNIKRLFPKIFAAKINWIKLKGFQVFYANKGYNIVEVIFF